MLNIEELDIDKLEATFCLKGPNKSLRSLYNTILARKKNANFCCEYFKRYLHKHKVQKALYDSKEPDLIVQGFSYNIFNRSILFCVFYALVSNNVSRIDNLESIFLELFRDELRKYANNPKSFSFKKLCEDFPDRKITAVLQKTFNYHKSFTKVQKLRDQMAHSTIDNILDNDPMLYEEDDYLIDPDYTLSGEKEDVVDFAKSLNELLLIVEEQVFNCLMTHGKDCLK